MRDSLKPDYFEADSQQPQDEQIDLADVDPDAFEFPKSQDQSKNLSGIGNGDTSASNNKLLSTADLINEVHNTAGPSAAAASQSIEKD